MLNLNLKKAITELLSDESAIELLSKSSKVIFNHIKNNVSVKSITEPFRKLNENFLQLIFELHDLNKNIKSV